MLYIYCKSAKLFCFVEHKLIKTNTNLNKKWKLKYIIAYVHDSPIFVLLFVMCIRKTWKSICYQILFDKKKKKKNKRKKVIEMMSVNILRFIIKFIWCFVKNIFFFFEWFRLSEHEQFIYRILHLKKGTNRCNFN